MQVVRLANGMQISGIADSEQNCQKNTSWIFGWKNDRQHLIWIIVRWCILRGQMQEYAVNGRTLCDVQREIGDPSPQLAEGGNT